MNYQRSATVCKQRVCAVAHVHTLIRYRHVGGSVGLDHKIIHVAGMWSFRVLQSVHLAFGIEMPARGFKSWTFTFCHLVNVYRVFARRQVLEIQFYPYSFARIGYRGSAHWLTTSVLQLNDMSHVPVVLSGYIRQEPSDYDSSYQPCNKVLL